MLCRCIRTPLQKRNTDLGLELLQNSHVIIFSLKGFGKWVLLLKNRTLLLCSVHVYDLAKKF